MKPFPQFCFLLLLSLSAFALDEDHAPYLERHRAGRSHRSHRMSRYHLAYISHPQTRRKRSAEAP